MHRLIWIETNGPIPEGLCVCHRCDNPPCCNPAHLFLGTKKDNTQDALRKGRLYTARGEDNANSKLTRNDVRDIRASHDTQQRLADRFGVSPTLIWLIRQRRAWRHVN